MLARNFFTRPAPQVAPALIGKRLVRLQNGKRLAGIITETEAYQGQNDLACHARVGRTKRTEPMFGQAGHAYIYFTYGMHWLFNIVTDEVHIPSAVLIRAIFPLEGISQMEENRPMLARTANWLNGPAKLTQGLGIDGALNEHDLCQTGSTIFLEDGITPPEKLVRTSPRIGLGKTPEPWLSIPWRWYLDWQDAKILIKENGL
ncbi:MAG: DNA-3-methyladenine glycosylase [Anaerolineaceae bacterium]|jgi:DNA-3-methyladenine glycosylase